MILPNLITSQRSLNTSVRLKFHVLDEIMKMVQSQPILLYKLIIKPASTWETEAEQSQVQGNNDLYSKFQMI